MYLKNEIIFTLLCLSTLCGFTYADSLTIERLSDCNDLSSFIRDDTLGTFATSSLNSLNNRYKLESKFTAGKGGAFVAKVQDKKTNEFKVLKIFPTIKTESNKYNYRELYYTCINGFITAPMFGFKLDAPYTDINLFPLVYEIGMTNTPNFETVGTDYAYPYMVFEFVKGKSLTTLGKDAKKDAAANLEPQDYRLYTKKQKGDDINKGRSEMVLYQIAQLLFKLKGLKFGDTEYGFYHADLNSGNIMVRDIMVSGSLDAGYGPIPVKQIPLVTFIDFGHSTSNLDSNLVTKSKLKDILTTAYHKTIHIFSGSTAEFYKNLNNMYLGKMAEIAIGLSSTNSDMRLYQVIGRALYDSDNYLNKKFMQHLSSCSDAKKCVENAPKLLEK